MGTPLRSTCVAVLVAFISCGKDTTAPGPGSSSDVHGTWAITEEIGTPDIGCTDGGTIAVTQSSAILTGTGSRGGSCLTPGGTVSNHTESGSLSGDVGASTIRFNFAGCDYHGNLFDTPIDSAGGDVSCTLIIGGSFKALTGIWWANLQVDPPILHGGVSPLSVPPGDYVAVTGEKVRIIVGATDKRGLRWIGYSLSPPVGSYDSVAVLDTAATDTFYVTVQAGQTGTSYLDLWARNSYNRLAYECCHGSVTTLDAVRHPSQSVSLGVRAADAVYDSARNLIYFTEPDSARVAVLSLATFTFGSPIRLPMIKRGLGFQSIDIVPGGDTAIVPLPDTSQLAFLDRVTNSVTTSRVNGTIGVDLLQVTANRKVLTISQVDSAGFVFFAVVERDLVTGRDSIRRDVGQMGHVNATATLWGSPDHSRVLILSMGSPSCAYVYEAATDEFSPCSSFFFTGTVPPSSSTHGEEWLVGETLLDSSLNVLGTVTPAAGGGLSPDGSVAYVPTFYGYNKIAVPSGALIESVRITALGVGSSRITALPEGTRLFLWDDANGFYSFGTNHATVVDLTH